MDFFRNLATAIEDEFTTIADDGKGSAEFTGLIDTGCYMLNAVISGSLYGGMQNNKSLGFAGETTTGKTYLGLGIVANFLKQNPNAGVVYYDTESAVTKAMMEDRGIDTKRVIIAEPQTIEGFRSHALNMLENYMKFPKDQRPPMMMVLDSLGMLSSIKELTDIAAGNNVRDMTKSQLIRAAFRVLTLKRAKAGVPLVINNHVYDVIGGNVPMKELSGGGGFKFAADSIAMLTKSKDRDENGVQGTFIKVTMYKARLAKENSQVQLKLSYKTGLDKYYGLLPLAEKYGIFKKMSTRYELPDGRKVFGKQINDNPTEYYTDDIMKRLEVAAQQEYKYGIHDTEEEHAAEVETITEEKE